MRRRRFQKGSLQLRKHADRRVWVVLYYDEKSERRYHTLGWASEMNKGTADEKRQEFMREINGGARTTGAIRPPTVTEFLEQVYLPFYLGKWKESTAGTSENRLRHHIVKELGPQRLEDLTLAPLQQFLERKAASGLSFSVVDHLRWDLSSLFERWRFLRKWIAVNPTAALYTPKTAKRSESRRPCPLGCSAKLNWLWKQSNSARSGDTPARCFRWACVPGELLAHSEGARTSGCFSDRNSTARVPRGSSRLQRTVWSVTNRGSSLYCQLPSFAIGWRRQWITIQKRTCLPVRPASAAPWRSSLLEDAHQSQVGTDRIGLGELPEFCGGHMPALDTTPRWTLRYPPTSGDMASEWPSMFTPSRASRTGRPLRNNLRTPSSPRLFGRERSPRDS